MKYLLIILLTFFVQQVQSQIGFGDKAITPRIKFGLDKIAEVQKELKLKKNPKLNFDIVNGKAEGFSIFIKNGITNIVGNDETGFLYACMEYAAQMRKAKGYPKTINIKDAPEMVLRGQCIGLQKPTYLPGRTVYEYPYTPETFPWFYDKKLWLQVLDSMVNNRMNSLYLWNGHPFASLVKLPDYPFAVEVDDATFKRNEDIYNFITTEADKRGIWVIQMFYNIIVSKPFAEHYNIKTQERERGITPLLADYTQKSIEAFVAKYPNVGLMVCLGEAMQGVGQDDIEWFTKTIIPGVKAGLKKINKTTEPPIVLRAHDTDAPSVMDAALPLYKNLYTEAKFNGEALTYATPRGDWKKLHNKLSDLGSVHIANVHLMSNLEPFRYGSPKFIQECVIGMVDSLKAKALHLYPQASYWDWPYSADSVAGGKRLLQIERDWIWYKAWARYAWKPKRNRTEEVKYWTNELANYYGCDAKTGKSILDAYETSGEVAPKLLRRFGITDGNRQTLTLGMLMTQLINPYRYGLFTLLYDAEAPVGESLVEYVEKEIKKEKHIGETPFPLLEQLSDSSSKAAFLMDSLFKKISRNKDEFVRFRSDMFTYWNLASLYRVKIMAATYVLKYKYTNDLRYLDIAKRLQQQSVSSYKSLVSITTKTYLYANSMQTQQRKIPMRGFNGAYKHWKEMLPVYEKELEIFTKRIDSLKNVTISSTNNVPVKLNETSVNLKNKVVLLNTNVEIFSDTSLKITSIAPQLKGLLGLELAFKNMLTNKTNIVFSNDDSLKVLVGYFNNPVAAFSTDTIFLKQPTLEINAAADDYGQAEAKILNALVIQGLPPINVHTYNFKPGNNTLKLEKGVCLILGFVKDTELIKVVDAKLAEGKYKNIDWLFE